MKRIAHVISLTQIALAVCMIWADDSGSSIILIPLLPWLILTIPGLLLTMPLFVIAASAATGAPDWISAEAAIALMVVIPTALSIAFNYALLAWCVHLKQKRREASATELDAREPAR